MPKGNSDFIRPTLFHSTKKRYKTTRINVLIYRQYVLGVVINYSFIDSIKLTSKVDHIDIIFICFSFSFAGSSTDLSPSVIGYYDRLSGSFHNDTVIGELRVKKSPEKQLDKSREQSPKPKLIVSKIPTKPTRPHNSSIPAPKSNSNQNFNSSAKTLQIISPNVQRMISSHQTTTETITASPTVKSFIHCLSQSKNNSRKANEASNLQTRRIFLKSNLPKPSNFAIPLTKNLSKISQSNGLVDSAEPIVHTLTDKSELIYQVDSEKTPTNCDHNFNYDKNCIFNDEDDDDIQNVLNKTSELINNLLSGNNNYNLGSLDIQEGKDNCLSGVDNDSAMMKGSNLVRKLHHDSDEDVAACEVVNTNLKVTKSLDNVAESEFKPTASPKLSYSRAKLLSNQQLKTPTPAPKFHENSSDSKLTASPSTKHRPLSAASISSSSSSTSTASSANSFAAETLVNGKLSGVTYLASIESLADHSENEGNPSLTMCERAALEIIESEKSYVEDLGQIIKG